MTIRHLLVLFALLATLAAAQPQADRPAPAEPQRQVKTYSLPPDKLAKAIEYARVRNWLHFIGFAYGVGALAVALSFRVAPRYRDWARAASARRIGQAYIFTPLLLLTLDVLELPLSAYDRSLSLKYGQSVQTWGSWFWDWTKSESIEFALVGLLVWMLYGMIRRSPRRWWLYCWLMGIPIVLFLLFLEPMVIEPMFFEFKPLASAQPALVPQIEKVVARGGLHIPRERMFEMKASEKLLSLNAYVTGIGASKRVVVWDTTMKKMTVDQTLFVFGHEMGHYVLGHMWFNIAGICALLLVCLYAGYHAMHRAIARWGARWKITGVDDWASLPLLILTVSILSFATEPVMSGWSRMLEHNADVYGLEVTHGLVPDSAQTAAQAFQILGETSLSDPNPSPFIEFWLYDHPAISDRVRFSAGYDPWSKGEPRKYVQ